MQPEINTGSGVTASSEEIKSPTMTPDEAMEKVNALGVSLRELILEVKKFPRDKTLQMHQEEMRCLAEAQNHLQTGFLWLRRAIKPTKEF